MSVEAATVVAVPEGATAPQGMRKNGKLALLNQFSSSGPNSNQASNGTSLGRLSDQRLATRPTRRGKKSELLWLP